MAFWGIEVKPGKPFTQKFDEFKGRLHVSLATLGFGTATDKSVLQCNVGNKSPVYLCSLLPKKTECLQLNLEFEEADEVIFSVIGPRSIHLSGYFLGSCRHTNLNDNSESYGVDIANTETEGSECSNEDKYDDSFINDDDPEIFPSSPISSGEEEALNKKQPKSGTRSHRRLRKKFQLSNSDDKVGSQEKKVAGGGVPFPQLESEDEDSLPISFICRNKTIAENTVVKTDENSYGFIDETNDGKTEVDDDFATEMKTDNFAVDGRLNRQSNIPIDSLLPGDVGTKTGAAPKKKLEEQLNENPENAVGETNGVLVEDKGVIEEEATSNSLVQGLCMRIEQEQTAGTQKHADLPMDSSVLSFEVSPVMGVEQKRKRKRRSEGNPGEAKNTTSYSNVTKDDRIQQDESTDNMVHNSSGRQKSKHVNEAEPTDNISLLSVEVGHEHSERPKKKKKGWSKEERTLHADDISYSNTIRTDRDVQTETKSALLGQVLHPANEHGAELPDNISLPSVEVGREHSERPKKKKKERSKKEITFNADDICYNTTVKEDRDVQTETKSDFMGQDLQPANEQSIEENVCGFTDENQPEGKRTEKKKKKSKTRKSGDPINRDMPLYSTDEQNPSAVEVGVRNENGVTSLSQIRTLPSGLIIEVLKSGNFDGKTAVSGKKISVFYVGKLKESGEIFEVTDRGIPDKFRLGTEGIIQGWNAGLNGMQVGEKRRLTIPPSMGYGSKGDREAVPPDSWLVYDFELVKVH